MTENHEPETYLGQIKVDGRWVDYARGHEAPSRTWQEAEPGIRRVVDWISGEVLIPAECEAFNEVRQGMCKRPLTALDDCPEAIHHREV